MCPICRSLALVLMPRKTQCSIIVPAVLKRLEFEAFGASNRRGSIVTSIEIRGAIPVAFIWSIREDAGAAIRKTFALAGDDQSRDFDTYERGL